MANASLKDFATWAIVEALLRLGEYSRHDVATDPATTHFVFGVVSEDPDCETAG